MSSLAQISLKLLNIDPRKDNVGIKILAIKDEQRPLWVYFDSRTSERQFLQEIFFYIKEPSIEIVPVAPDEVRPSYLQRLGQMEDNRNRTRKAAKEEMQAQRTFLLQQPKFNKTDVMKPLPTNQLSATIDKRQSEMQTQRDLKQQGQSIDTEYISVSSSSSQQPEDIHERQVSRLPSELVYDSPQEMIGLPQYGSNSQLEIGGGPDFPTIYPRVLTLAEIKHSRRQLRLRENQIPSPDAIQLEELEQLTSVRSLSF